MFPILKRAKPVLSARIIMIHAICWLMLITLEMSVLIHLQGSINKPFQYIFFYALNIILFYGQFISLNYGGRINKTNVVATLLRSIAIIIVFLFIKCVVTYYLFVSGTNKPFLYLTKSYFPENLYRSLYFSILAVFFWAARYVEYYRAERLQAEKDRLNADKVQSELKNSLAVAQNAYYQQQINPHLLFNALNFIYDNTYRLSKPAGEAVILLSDIMRYSLNPAGSDHLVPLEDEVQQIRNLIRLNEYRFDGKMDLQFTVDGDLAGPRVLPLVMATLVENVFKHGKVTDPEHPARINIRITGQTKVVFSTFNRKKALWHVHERPGQGLANVRIRLASAYGDRYEFAITDDAAYYETFLSFEG